MTSYGRYPQGALLDVAEVEGRIAAWPMRVQAVEVLGEGRLVASICVFVQVLQEISNY
jgi:hypothetical protein